MAICLTADEWFAAMELGDEVIRIGEFAWDAQQVVLVLAGSAVALLLVLVVAVVVALTRRGPGSGPMSTELAELKGRVQSVSEAFLQGQTQLSNVVHDRLTENSRSTSESLTRLSERLAVFDRAQETIGELSSSLFSLQSILSDKQQRGAFGQGRMEAIVQDALPASAYSFQATLSNGKRPDCLIHIPHAPSLAIDAKFPLEGFEALRRAESEEGRKQASQQVRQDVGRHIGDIAAKYRIEGETQHQALMFVPSESIYLDLHESFPELLQTAARAGVVIVSPNVLMLAVQTMVGILKDARMREQAGEIQREVGLILQEVEQLGERVLRWQGAFRKLSQELESVVAGIRRIAERGERIGLLDLTGTDTGEGANQALSAEQSGAP